MEGPGDEVLAHATLSTDQHRRISIGDVVDDRPDGPHRGASVEQWAVVGELTLWHCLRGPPVRYAGLIRIHGHLPREGSPTSGSGNLPGMRVPSMITPEVSRPRSIVQRCKIHGGPQIVVASLKLVRAWTK